MGGKDINQSIVDDAKTVYEQMPTVGTVLGSTSMEINIALIVLSYLYNKSGTSLWIDYDRDSYSSKQDADLSIFRSSSSPSPPLRDRSSVSHSILLPEDSNERQSLLAADTADGGPQSTDHHVP